MTFLARMAPRAGKTSAAARIATVNRHLSSTSARMTDEVVYESVGSARVYKLNRPKALNALNQDMIESMAKQVTTWRESDLCKLMIGRGDERAFCAGGDVKTLVESRPEHGSKLALKFFKEEFELNWELGRFGKPYVAVIDGFTMGGGAGISLPGQIRVATKKTVFAMPETKIGYAPDVGGNYYIAQLDGQVGAWLAITGQETWGRAVYELGIATHYVDPASIPDMLSQLTALEGPTPESVSKIVASYHVPPPGADTPVSSKESREGPSPITGEIRAFLDKAFGHDSIQEIYADLVAAEGDASLSAEVKAWAAKQKKMFDERSPTGMAVALANFRLAQKTRRLNTVLENDLLMATGFVGNDRPTEDFSTGVTHLLISKAKGKADWKPADINDAFVKPDSIKKNFLDRNTPHLKEVPQLNFNPVPGETEGPDGTWGGFRRFGLPAEAEVAEWVKGENPQAGAFKLKEGELIQRMVDVRGDAGSPREKEIVDRIKNIVAKHCSADKDGYLNWNN